MTENLASYPRHGYVETHRATEHGYRRVVLQQAAVIRQRRPAGP